MRALSTEFITPEARYGYIPGLDGIRAVAVSIVIAAHLGLAHIVPGGFGVTVFFFISGFLITRLLLAEAKTKGIGLKDFYIRRFVRLIPALAFMVLGTTALWAALGLGGPGGWELAAALGYATNIYWTAASAGLAEPFMSWTHLWSLAVEEHFYLVFPALVVALGAARRRLIMAVGLLLLIVPLWRLVLTLSLSPEVADTWTYMMSDARIDSILWGCWLSLLLDRADGRAALSRLVGWTPILAALATLLACFAVRDAVFRQVLRYSLQGGALLVVVLNLYHFRPVGFAVRMLEWRSVAKIGTLSYALYLWHYPVLELAQRGLPGGTPMAEATRVVVVLCASYAMALFSFRFVEGPFIALRKRFGAHIVRTPEAAGAATMPVRVDAMVERT